MVLKAIRSLARQAALSLGTIGIVAMAVAAVLAVACATVAGTTVASSLRTTDVTRVRLHAAAFSMLANNGRLAVHDLLAASAGYLNPEEGRAIVRKRWRDLQVSVSAFCADLDGAELNAERMRSLCSTTPAFFERVMPQVLAFDPVRHHLDRGLMQEIFDERQQMVEMADSAVTRADALIERMRGDYRRAQIVMGASSAGFGLACLSILFLIGRASRVCYQHGRAAAESRRLLMEIIEILPAGLVLFDQRDRLTMFNTAAARSSPILDRPDVLATTYAEMAPVSVPLSSEEDVGTIGAPREWPGSFRCGDGKMRRRLGERWFEWSDRVTPSGHTVSLRVEITEHMRRTHELELALADLQTLLEALPDTVYKLDIRSGRLTFVNSAATRLFGRTRTQLMDTNFLDLVAEEDRASVAAIGHGGSLVPGVASVQAQFRIKTSATGTRSVEVRFSTVVDAFGGAIVGVMRIVHDYNGIHGGG